MTGHLLIITECETGGLRKIETVPYGTVLSELSGAGEQGDLEAVFRHRNHS